MGESWKIQLKRSLKELFGAMLDIMFFMITSMLLLTSFNDVQRKFITYILNERINWFQIILLIGVIILSQGLLFIVKGICIFLMFIFKALRRKIYKKTTF